jgi:hypothetical protein
MPRLEPEAVLRFLARLGGRFRHVFLVFQPEGALIPNGEDAYIESFVREGWVLTEARTLGVTRVVGLSAP